MSNYVLMTNAGESTTYPSTTAHGYTTREEPIKLIVSLSPDLSLHIWFVRLSGQGWDTFARCRVVLYDMRSQTNVLVSMSLFDDRVRVSGEHHGGHIILYAELPWSRDKLLDTERKAAWPSNS